MDIVEQLNSLIGMGMNILLFMAYVAVLKLIFFDIFPPYFKAGTKLTFRGIISPFIAFAMMLIAIQNAPALLASSISEGYSRAMPEFDRVGSMVLRDLGGESYTPPVQQTTYAEQPVSAAAPSNNPQSVQQTTYFVESGDTLATIAHKYEISPKMLADENAISDGTIQVGQKLYIPESCTFTDASGTVHLCPPLP